MRREALRKNGRDLTHRPAVIEKIKWGADREDLRQLFAHSSLNVTDRYIRDRWSNLEKVTKVIRLFPEKRIKKADNL